MKSNIAMNNQHKLAERLLKLTPLQRREVEHLLGKYEAINAGAIPQQANKPRDWPHAPLHRLEGRETFIVTAGTLNKAHYFRDAARLDMLESELLSKAKEYAWRIEAWAVFSNHYHFVGQAEDDSRTLKAFLTHLHAETARKVNEEDDEPGRQVWFNYWETALTFEKSYFARLNYVHQNAVRHRLVPVANQYKWCSAAWFERTATPSQVKTIYGFRTDRVKVNDDFDVLDVR